MLSHKVWSVRTAEQIIHRRGMLQSLCMLPTTFRRQTQPAILLYEVHKEAQESLPSQCQSLLITNTLYLRAGLHLASKRCPGYQPILHATTTYRRPPAAAARDGQATGDRRRAKTVPVSVWARAPTPSAVWT